MSAKSRKRRSPGEGGCWPYKTKAGERFRVAGPVRMPDGTTGTARKRGFLTKADGLAWLQEQQVDGRKGDYVEPSKQKFGDYGAEVIEGMRLKPQTRASYVKNWRLHVQAYPIAAVPLAQLTGKRLSSHYRLLEKSGRKDHRAGEGLSPRTVRYISTIVHAVLKQAVTDQVLRHNAADAATPPTAREAKAAAPDMNPWTAVQLAAFLAWAGGKAQNAALWLVLAYTGMRRGELLTLRWRDVDLDGGCLRVRRSAGIVRYAGEGAEMVENDTKTSKPRVIDLDPGTVAALKSWRKERGMLALQLVRDDALVFGDLEGEHRNGEHVSRQFKRDQARCRKELGDDAVPEIRLHDLRHTHATLLLLAREPVHVVSQRLGHSSPVVTMTVYAHVLPGNQLEAANTFARLIREASA